MERITSRPHQLLIPLVGMALLLAACSSSGTGAAATATATASASAIASASASASQPASSGAATVKMVGFQFDPTALTVKAGTRVTFTNSDSALHEVAEGENGKKADPSRFDESVKPGASTTITFDTAGTVHVTCLIHPTMNLTVTVGG